MRIRPAPLLFAALMAGAAFPLLAGAPGIGYYIGDFEQVVIAHLIGSKKTMTFENLAQRQKRLSSELETAKPADYEELAQRLKKIESLLKSTKELARGGDRLDSKLEAALLGATRKGAKAERIDTLEFVSRQLLEAAVATSAKVAKRIFDGDELRQKVEAEDLEAVKADFGAKDPIIFTPSDDPRIKGRKSGKKPPTPETAPEPEAKAAEGGAPLAVAARAAFAPIQRRLPNGEEKQFLSDRQQSLEGLKTLAAMALGAEADGLDLDAMIARLSKGKANLGRNAKTTETQLQARLESLKASNPDLAAFAAAWLIHSMIVAEALENGHVPIGTVFKPWELYPKGQEAVRAEVVGVTRKGTDFIGLRFENADKSSIFAAVSADGMHAVRIVKDRLGAQEITSRDFDGAGKLKAQTVERLGADGAPLVQVTTTEKSRVIRFEGGKAPFQMQVERINPDGTIVLVYRVSKDGQKLEQVSAHVKRLLKGGATQLWDVDAAGALPEDGGQARKAAALALAKETLEAIGEDDPDGRKARAFADFLYYNAVISGGVTAHGKDPALRLTIAAGTPKVFTLALQNGDGSRKVFTGFFDVASTPAAPPAFLVQNEVEFDAQGNMKDADKPEAQKRATRVAYEYLGGGVQIFRLDPETEKVAAFEEGDSNENLALWLIKKPVRGVANFFSDKREVTHRKFQRRIADPSKENGWRVAGEWEAKPTERFVDGSAPALGVAEGILGFPGIKQAVGGCNSVGNFLYTGGANLLESGAEAANGGDLARLNSVATRARNPAWAYKIAGSQPDGQKDPAAFEAWAKKILAELTPGARRLLDERVMNMRPERLSLIVNRQDSPLYFEKAVRLPPTDLEAYFTLLSEFGAGTYGKQLARRGHTYLAPIVSGGEALAEMACNPMTWVLPAVLSKLGKLPSFCAKKAEEASLGGGAGWKAAKTFTKGLNNFVLIPSAIAPFAAVVGHDLAAAYEFWGTPTGSDYLGRSLADGLFIGGMSAHSKFGQRVADYFKPKKGAEPTLLADAPASSVPGEGGVKIDSPAFGEAPALERPLERGLDLSPETAPERAPGERRGSSSSEFAGEPASRRAAEETLAPEAPETTARVEDPAPPQSRSREVSHEKPASDGPSRADTKSPAPEESRTFAASENSGGEPGGRGDSTARAAEPTAARSAEPAVRAERTPARSKKGSKTEEVAQRDPEGNLIEEKPKGKETVKPEDEAPLKKIGDEAPPKSRLRRAIEHFVERGGLGGAMARLSPSVPLVANKPTAPWKVDEQPVIPEKKDPTPSAEQPKPEQTPKADPKDDRDDTRSDRDYDDNNNRTKNDQKETPPAENVGGGGGGVVAMGPEQHSPKLSMPGGFGGKGGAGGGGGGGGGGDAGGGGAPSSPDAGKGSGGGSAPEVSAAPPAGARPAAFAGPTAPRQKPAASTGGEPNGGHSPEESLAKKFDNADPHRGDVARASTPMSGLPGSDSGMMVLNPRGMPATARAAAAAPRGNRNSASDPAFGPRSAAEQGGDDEENYNFTYQSPARHKYGLAEDRPKEKKDWRYVAGVGARGSAAVALIYLVHHSELGYLLGFVRRRRKNVWTPTDIEAA